MASAAELLERALVRYDRDVLVKWQAIQDHIGDMPADSLRDLIVDVVRILHVSEGVVTVEVVHVIDTWYYRALFARDQRLDPVDAVTTREAWEKLPERSF